MLVWRNYEATSSQNNFKPTKKSKPRQISSVQTKTIVPETPEKEVIDIHSTIEKEVKSVETSPTSNSIVIDRNSEQAYMHVIDLDMQKLNQTILCYTQLPLCKLCNDPDDLHCEKTIEANHKKWIKESHRTDAKTNKSYYNDVEVTIENVDTLMNWSIKNFNNKNPILCYATIDHCIEAMPMRGLSSDDDSLVKEGVRNWINKPSKNSSAGTQVLVIQEFNPEPILSEKYESNRE